MSFLDILFGGGDSDPAAAAMPFLEQARGEVSRYLDPYTERGQRSGGLLEEELGQMVQDPSAMIERYMAGYEPSKRHDVMQQRLSQAAANTAAAGGMRGSPFEQTRQQELTASLLGEDMQKYLQNILGLHSQGLAGEQGLYGTGFQAARGASGDIANILGTEGQLAFQGEREKQKRDSDLMNALITGLGAAFGAM